MKQRLLIFLMIAVMALSLTACAQDVTAPTERQTDQAADTAAPEDEAPAAYVSEITLNGSSVSAAGEGITVSGSTVTITAPGAYSISGTLDDGQIIVEASKDDEVDITLGGVTVHCSTSAPFYVKSADLVTVTLADGTVNTFTDTAHHVLNDDDEPDACFFSKDDLTITGGGSLIVTAEYKNGIGTKDDLKIKDGSITVTAVNDGLRGNDSVRITGGILDISALTGDGIDSNNAEESDKGYVLITNGDIKISAGKHGIKTENYVSISGGSIIITAIKDGIKSGSVYGVAENDVTINSSRLNVSESRIESGS